MEFEKTIKIPANNPTEAIVIAQSLKTIAENFTYENIQLLAQKSSKPGINERLQSYKNLI